jgi:hypothetical protein
VRLSRTNWLLLAVLVSLAALDTGLSLSRPEAREIARLFPALWPGDALRIRIESPTSPGPSGPSGAEAGARTGAAPRRIELERRGANWVLTERFDMHARESRVSVLLEHLTSLTNLDRVSDSPAEHERYGVGLEGTIVRVFGPDDSLLAALVQGLEAPQGPGDRLRSTWVRPLGEDAVYRAAGLEAITLGELDWMENRWMDFEFAAVATLSWNAGEGVQLELTREPNDRWVAPDGRVLAKGLVQDFLTHLRGLFFDTVEGRVEPDAEPAAFSVRLELYDGTSLEAFLGEADGQGRRSAWRSDVPWRVGFAGSMVEPLLRRARSLPERLQ